MAELKDSGSRRGFGTGAVRDMAEGKGRCDLLPLREVAELMDNDPVLHLFADVQATDDTAQKCRLLKDALAYLGAAKPARLDCPNFVPLFPNLSTLIIEVSKQFEDGARKYGDNNWRKGIPARCYLDSATRHYLKHLRGDHDEPHDRAACWNIICMIWELRNHDQGSYQDSEEARLCQTQQA